MSVQMSVAEQFNQVWMEVGFIRWPLAFSFMTVVGLGLFSAVRLFRPGAMADLYTKAWLDAILFWGGLRLDIRYVGHAHWIHHRDSECRSGWRGERHADVGRHQSIHARLPFWSPDLGLRLLPVGCCKCGGGC